MRVVIEGLRQVPEEAVRKDLCLGTARCPIDNPEALERDGLVIQANLFDLGYVASNVATPEVRRGLDAVEVVYRVTEGERFRLKKISVNEPDPAARVRKQIKLPAMNAKNGDWFSRKVVAEDRSRIERAYRDAGYANVDVRVESEVGTEVPEISLSLVITRGPIVRIKAVETDPPELANTVLVLTTKNGLLPGALFNETKIVEVKALLELTGATVSVATFAADGRDDQVVVRYEISR